MRGVIYARYSPGPHQTDQSIEGQVADCTSFAAENDISIVEIYADRHISGKSIDGRDEFQRMIRDARKKLFDCVIVWKVDRFGRNRQDIALYKLELKRAGVKLMYAKESIPDGEQAVIRATMKDMLTDDMIERLTKRIMEIQEEDFARDPAAAFRRQLDSNQKKQRNILDAIEDGAPAKGLTTRLMELEKAEEDLLQKIDHAAIKKPRLTIELVRAWLCSFRAGDVSDPDFQRRLLDTFVARVELKNGEAVVFYNARPDHGRGKCSTTITKVETTGVEPISIAANVPYSLSLQTSWNTFVEYTSTEFPIHQLNFQFIN